MLKVPRARLNLKFSHRRHQLRLSSSYARTIEHAGSHSHRTSAQKKKQYYIPFRFHSPFIPQFFLARVTNFPSALLASNWQPFVRRCELIGENPENRQAKTYNER